MGGSAKTCPPSGAVGTTIYWTYRNQTYVNKCIYIYIHIHIYMLIIIAALTGSQRTRGPEDQRTRRPKDQRTRGPEDQSSTCQQSWRQSIHHATHIQAIHYMPGVWL